MCRFLIPRLQNDATGEFMRLPLFLLGFTAVFPMAALGEDDCRCWTPDAVQVAVAEAKVRGRKLPLGGLDQYARYYAGTIYYGRRYIRGKLVPAGGSEAPGVHIVEGRMPPLQGEGCVTNTEPDSGPWLYLNCARPGAWMPSDSQIIELEGLLRLPEGARLQDYARHYAGVAEGGRQIVIGELVIPRSDERTGIYIGSEAELPMINDGGCSVVTVRFDPSSKAVHSRCHGKA
jgi:hypothetical protein